MRLTHGVGKVAIVGGGYAGMLCGLNICNRAHTVHVYDGCNVGLGGASAASGGLMHPASPKGNMIVNGLEGYRSSLSTMESLKSAVPFMHKIDLHRPLIEEKEVRKWSHFASKVPEWVDVCKSTRFAHNEAVLSTVTLKNTVVVDSSSYLKAVWENIQSHQAEAEWRKEFVADLSALSKVYNLVLLTSGVGSYDLWNNAVSNPTHILGGQLVRGQNLYYDVPNFNFNEGIYRDHYIVPTVDQSSAPVGYTRVVCGANYEYLKTYDRASHNQPNIPRVKTDIHESLCSLLPVIASLDPVHCTAGVRLVGRRAPEGRLPMMGRHPDLPNVWMLSAFGSRGLLYHALTAEMLCRAVVEDDESLIPSKYKIRYGRPRLNDEDW